MDWKLPGRGQPSPQGRHCSGLPHRRKDREIHDGFRPSIHHPVQREYGGGCLSARYKSHRLPCLSEGSLPAKPSANEESCAVRCTSHSEFLTRTIKHRRTGMKLNLYGGLAVFIACFTAIRSQAEVRVPTLIGDHM